MLRENLRRIIINLIESGNTNFLFGGRSEFNDLCYELITQMKHKYPNIKRIKYRTNYEQPDEYTLKFLNAGYEENIAPKGIENAGKTVYIKRNQAMIEKSDICIFYYNENYLPPCRQQNNLTVRQSKSGTATAYTYAVKQKKIIYNLYNKL